MRSAPCPTCRWTNPSRRTATTTPHSPRRFILSRPARAALWSLTPEQRLVIALKYFGGLSNEEVAVALGKPISAVKSLQHRALDALRRLLVNEVIEERVAL